MALSRRQKLTIIPLLFYWPAIFIFAHTPIPQIVYRARVSDKYLHFLAYLVLVSLLLFVISPDRTVNWRRASVWRVLFVAVLYALVDELLQPWVGRTCDISDFLADLMGLLAGLILLVFLSFWPAVLVITGIAVFLLTNLCRTNPGDLMPVTSLLFYLLSYGLFTLIWIRYMNLRLTLKPPCPKWLLAALVVPAAFLVTAKLFSVILGRPFSMRNVIISAVAIAVVIIIFFLAALFRRRSAQRHLVS